MIKKTWGCLRLFLGIVWRRQEVGHLPWGAAWTIAKGLSFGRWPTKEGGA